MTNTYKVNHQFLKKLLRNNFIVLLLASILGPLVWIYGDFDFNFTLQFLLLLSLVLLSKNISSILIYLNYYSENRNTSLSLDWTSKKIIISKKGFTKKYQENDVLMSTHHLAIYHKNNIDNKKRWKALTSDFCYWELKFKNGDNYFLTSLMIDFLHRETFVNNTKYRFRLFPFILKTDTKEGIDNKLIVKVTWPDRTHELYSRKSESELVSIIQGGDTYTDYAKEVAQKFLDKKSDG